MELPMKKTLWVAIAAAVQLAAPLQAQQVNADACYVSDSNAGTALDGLIFSVNESDGSRTVISDFNDTTLGPHGMEPTGMALLDAETLLVLDISAGQRFTPVLMTVDIATGVRAIVTEFGEPAQGPTGRFTRSLIVTSDNTVLVTDGFSGTDNNGSLLTVDLTTGQRTLVSDMGDISQGPLGLAPNSVMESSDGRILLLDQNSGADRGGSLYRIDLATGLRTVISDFNTATQGPTGVDPTDMVELPSGELYVTDFGGGTDDAGQILRVLANGNRELVSDFGDPSQGATSGAPISIATDADGQLIVLDANANAMLSVDPATGQRTVASDFDDATQGVTGLSLTDVLVIGGAPVEVDSDGDSVPDEIDQCPEADNANTVVINDCDSDVDNVVLADGCTISQTLAAAAGSASSPQRESTGRKQGRPQKNQDNALKSVLRSLTKDGIISRSEKAAISSCL